MKIDIDLLWVRSGKNGGTESVVRNILDVFLNTQTGNMISFSSVTE